MHAPVSMSKILKAFEFEFFQVSPAGIFHRYICIFGTLTSNTFNWLPISCFPLECRSADHDFEGCFSISWFASLTEPTFAPLLFTHSFKSPKSYGQPEWLQLVGLSFEIADSRKKNKMKFDPKKTRFIEEPRWWQSLLYAYNFPGLFTGKFSSDEKFLSKNTSCSFYFFHFGIVSFEFSICYHFQTKF